MEVLSPPPLADLARLAALDDTQEDNFAAMEQEHPLVLRMALHVDSQGDGHADQLACTLLQHVPLDLQVPANENPTGDVGGMVLHIDTQGDPTHCPAILPMLLSLVDSSDGSFFPLHTLNLHGVPLTDDDIHRTLAAAPLYRSATTLCNLCLAGCAITHRSLVALVNRLWLPALQRLELSSTAPLTLSEPSCQLAMRMLAQSAPLQLLSMHHTGMTEADAVAFCQCIAQGLRTPSPALPRALRCLHLGPLTNPDDSNEPCIDWSDRVVAALVDLVHQCPALGALHMHGAGGSTVACVAAAWGGCTGKPVQRRVQGDVDGEVCLWLPDVDTRDVEQWPVEHVPPSAMVVARRQRGGHEDDEHADASHVAAPDGEAQAMEDEADSQPREGWVGLQAPRLAQRVGAGLDSAAPAPLGVWHPLEQERAAAAQEAALVEAQKKGGAPVQRVAQPGRQRRLHEYGGPASTSQPPRRRPPPNSQPVPVRARPHAQQPRQAVRSRPPPALLPADAPPGPRHGAPVIALIDAGGCSPVARARPALLDRAGLRYGLAEVAAMDRASDGDEEDGGVGHDPVGSDDDATEHGSTERSDEDDAADDDDGFLASDGLSESQLRKGRLSDMEDSSQSGGRGGVDDDDDDLANLQAFPGDRHAAEAPARGLFAPPVGPRRRPQQLRNVARPLDIIRQRRAGSIATETPPLDQISLRGQPQRAPAGAVQQGGAPTRRAWHVGRFLDTHAGVSREPAAQEDGIPSPVAAPAPPTAAHGSQMPGEEARPMHVRSGSVHTPPSDDDVVWLGARQTAARATVGRVEEYSGVGEDGAGAQAAHRAHRPEDGDGAQAAHRAHRPEEDADGPRAPSAARKRLLRELQDLEPFAYDKRKTIAPPNTSKFYAREGQRRRAPPDAYAAYVHDVLSPSSSLGLEGGSEDTQRGAGHDDELDSEDDVPLAQLLRVPARREDEVLADRCAQMLS